MINEQDLNVTLGGVIRTGNSLPSFLIDATIQNETTTYPLQAATLTVALLNQVVFNLGFVPAPASIRSVVINRKTYFEPDFTVANQTLTWNLGVLPIGTVIVFEAAGAEQNHRRKQTLPITLVGARQFELSTVPRGYEVEVYLNGFLYTSASGAFRVKRNTLLWEASTLKPSDKLVVIFARTPEGSLLYQYDDLRVSPAAPSNFRLSLEVRTPQFSRLYFKGLRYFNATDYVTALDDLTVVTPLAANHGEALTFVQPTDATYFRKVNESGRLDRQVFVTTNQQIVTNGPTTVPLTNPSVKSILAVNGLMYAEGSGYTRTPGQVTWTNALSLGIGDEFSLLGFFEQPAADSVKFMNFTGLVGYPTIDLGEKAADIRKAMVFIAADGNFGGEVYMGHLYLQFPTVHQITWAGPFPLKATDRITVVFLKNPALAAGLVLESHQVTVPEGNQPFAFKLRRPPVEPNSVIFALNGARVVQPVEFIVNDDAVIYHNANIRVKALDVATFLYR